MGFFVSNDDAVTGKLNVAFRDVLVSIQEEMGNPEMNSFNVKEAPDDMGPPNEMESPEDGTTHEGLEARLTAILARPIAETLPQKADHKPILQFLESYYLSTLFPDTVGTVEEILSTVSLKNLPHFKTRHISREQRDATFEKLCLGFDVRPSERMAILDSWERANASLQKRRRLIDAIRTKVKVVDGAPTKESAKDLFDLYFPGNPFQKHEIDLVLTRTCIYWCVPTIDVFEKSEGYKQRSHEEKDDAIAWLKRLKRFNFKFFSHFPTFSSFDSRDAHKDLVGIAENALETGLTDAVDLLNESTTIETLQHLEKYLIHDTWGHIWQADLTDLKHLYDAMESLQTPVAASEHLVVDGNVVTLLDTLYLRHDGELYVNKELEERYADEWLRIRVTALFGPVVSELTANMVGTKFRLDNPGIIDFASTTSDFHFNPAKLDFAWVDIRYFFKTLKQINTRYVKNSELRELLIRRVSTLLKLKYTRQFNSVPDHDRLAIQIEEAVDGFLTKLIERQELHLNTELEMADGDEKAPHINAFFQMFTNFLQVQFTLNEFIKNHLTDHENGVPNQYIVLLLATIQHFQTDASQRFWDLDEMLATYALPMLRAIDAAEKSVRG